MVVVVLFTLGEESLLEATLQSVSDNLHHTELLLGCGSSDAEAVWKKTIRGMGFEEICSAVFFVLPSTNAEKVSFAEIVSLAGDEHPGVDILVVLPGVILPQDLDLRLQWSAAQEYNIASLSPSSNAAECFSPYFSESIAQLPGATELDRLVHDQGQREHYEMPCFNPACVYLPAQSIQLLNEGIQSYSRYATWEEQAWHAAKLLRQLGHFHFIADHVFVTSTDSNRIALFDTFLNKQDEITLMERVHPLTALRYSLKGVLAEDHKLAPAIAGIEDKPVQLHIMHSWGGGLSHWVRDYCRHDTSRSNLVLKSIGTWGGFGQSLALYKEFHHSKPIKVWQLSCPVLATTITNREYRRILDSIIEEFGVDAILVSSLIGHSLDALETGVKTSFICHDFYPACPGINIHFGETCRKCDEQRLAKCLKDNALYRFFENVSADEWLAIRQRFQHVVVENQIAMICPTPSVKSHMVELFPGLREATFTVIPHGLDLPDIVDMPQPSGEERKKILVLGSLAPHKGFDLLKDTISEISHLADLYLVGCGKEGEVFANYQGVTIIAGYHHPDLVDIIGDISPDFALLLSIWPETFSYTLSEIYHFGIVPVATNLGSFADRISNGETGLLFEPDNEPLLAIIEEICSNSEKLVRIRQEIENMPSRTCAEMVEDYHQLLPLPAHSAARYFWHQRKACTFGSTMGGGGSILFLSNQETIGQAFIQIHEYLRIRILSAKGLKGWQIKIAAFFLRAMFSALIRTVRIFRRG